jgi:hypothetical protein
MSRYIQINSCEDCPFKGHSGAFTPGGASLLCDNKEARKDESIPGVKQYNRPFLNPKKRIEIPKQFPEFCPLLKFEEISLSNKIKEALR